MVNPSDLMARRQRLAAELAKLDELLSAFNAYASEFAPDLLDETAPAQMSAPTHSDAPKPKSRMTATIESPINTMTADVVATVMERENRPLTLAECERAVRESTVPVPDTKNPRNVIGTRLHRTGRFRSIQGVGWWFKDRPVPGGHEIAPDGAERNEAPAGDAEGASETGEVAASPIENRPSFRLIG